MTTFSYPKVSVLRRGVFLRAILNAIATTEHDDYARLLSWDGKNYVLNSLDGKYAAIVFEGNNVVGVFFDPDSPNNPYKSHEQYETKRFFIGMPKSLQALADQALRFNHQSYEGNTMALVTAAFWSEGEYLKAAVSWEEVLANGAHIIRIELIDEIDLALKEWEEQYACSPDCIALARSLFERRMITSETSVVLSESEMRWLESHAESSEALKDCLRALQALRILPPQQGQSVEKLSSRS